MKKLTCKLFVLMITAAIAGLATGQNGGEPATLNQISGYRQWTRINADPVKVDIPVKIDPGLVAA